MSEELVVRLCSPTLAGIKTGSLFSYSYESKEELNDSLRDLNHRLAPKGLRVIAVKVTEKHALIYLFRPKKLEEVMSQQDVRDILSARGYSCDSTGLCMVKLKERLNKGDEFPHEIGLFLGYPAEDVAGFIKNKGEFCKCTGCWKVYGDETYAKKQFAKYKKCTDIYCKLLENGSSIEKLAVAG